MFSFVEASSRAAMYCSLKSTFIIVQLYPPEISIKFIRKRAIRPFPSVYGWMKTKMKCPRTALTAGFSSFFNNSNNSSMQSGTASLGGGTCLDPLI